MAQRKQPAGARRRGRTRNEEASAYAGEKPMRETGAAASARAQAAEEAVRRASESVIGNGEEAASRMQEAGLLWSQLAQDALRQNVETAQHLMRCRTFGEVVEVQSDWMRRSLDNFLGRGARLSELSAQLAIDTMSRFRNERPTR
jgi:hypothetical protein